MMTRRRWNDNWLIPCMAVWLVLLTTSAWAGPYRPAAGTEGSHAIHMLDEAFVYWADGYLNYQVGDNVDSTWQTPEKALGMAQGTSFDVVSLGAAGRVTLTFDSSINDGDGWDFAVFENGFEDSFLELAYVEVSSDGTTFVRFDNASLTSDPVPSFGSLDPTNIDGLAGKYHQGYGTPFDLQSLSGEPEVTQGDVDLSAITHVRITDIVGDGTYLDSSGRVIFDLYPTFGSAGFDLDAVGVSNGAPYPEGEWVPPDIPPENGEAGFGSVGGCFINTLR
ncbi:MAG: PEP-CTERM sorting domain-containing protein [Deltaproteobacteria bacterium]|nr:PEP-CTERM sorting domain-containing protein [Deltaproteobacteria bacterium]MBW2678441.1 PEP-CTERM sorting domain-containing protein [Deltaproteobacteria bacterium]